MSCFSSFDINYYQLQAAGIEPETPNKERVTVE